MHPEMFAVVNAKSCSGYRFSIFHDSLDKAKSEAMRLAKQENELFYVLKVVGYAEVIDVNWMDL